MIKPQKLSQYVADQLGIPHRASSLGCTYSPLSRTLTYTWGWECDPGYMNLTPGLEALLIPRSLLRQARDEWYIFSTVPRQPDFSPHSPYENARYCLDQIDHHTLMLQRALGLPEREEYGL